MSLFVDTSVWYAAADSTDRSNLRAKAMLSPGEPLVTTDHVLIETWTFSGTEFNAMQPSDFGTDQKRRGTRRAGLSG